MSDPGTGGASWAEVAVASLRAVRDFDRFVAPVLHAHGVPNLGMTNVLFLLAIGPGRRRMSDVAREERCQGSNASYALNVLVSAGLAVPAVDPDDRRMRVVSLTDAGRQLHAEIRRVSNGDERAVSQAIRASGLLTAAAARPLADVRGPAQRGTAQPLLIALDRDLVYGPGHDAVRPTRPPAPPMGGLAAQPAE